MITQEQKKVLKEIIGSKCLLQLSQYFNRYMIINREGDPYSQVYISGVLNGRLANPTIEDGIWRFAEHLKIVRQADEERKAEILKPIKLSENE